MMQSPCFLPILPVSGVNQQMLTFTLKFILVVFSLLVSTTNLSAEDQTAQELVFVTSDHCPFCKAWEREVGKIYGSTPYARQARLRRVDIAEVDSALSELATDIFGTPTFLILENNMEVGRIEGYQSSDLFFWALSEYISP